MSDTPVGRDESGRFVKADQDTRPPDIEHDYHPLALRLFGWTRSSRVLVILTGLTLVLLVAVIGLSAGPRQVSDDLRDMTGFYAALGGLSVFFFLVAGFILRALLGRNPDYYGEAETQPDDVEARL
ncbi:MAG: hypothetical protein AAF296_00725 [Pseudomonadota bacterium]